MDDEDTRKAYHQCYKDMRRWMPEVHLRLPLYDTSAIEKILQDYEAQEDPNPMTYLETQVQDVISEVLSLLEDSGFTFDEPRRRPGVPPRPSAAEAARFTALLKTYQTPDGLDRVRATPLPQNLNNSRAHYHAALEESNLTKEQFPIETWQKFVQKGRDIREQMEKEGLVEPYNPRWGEADEDESTGANGQAAGSEEAKDEKELDT